MTYYDVFNGDADGICALHQWRLAKPCKSQLITGVKRDISLLKQVQTTAEDEVLVLDISLDKNREALQKILQTGAAVRYFDHHFAGEIPQAANLDAHINTDADVCTSLLVNEVLQGEYLPWAVAAAFGDNLFEAAQTAAKSLHLNRQSLLQLQKLGTLINYNGYGADLADLYFSPADLYAAIAPFEEPLAFVAEAKEYKVLRDGYQEDLQRAHELPVKVLDWHSAVVMLPDAAWARRVSGVYGNDLARQFPDRAHALLTTMPDGTYRISVRAPLSRKWGADELCMQFETGGGRKASAGINALAKTELDNFLAAFKVAFL